MRRSLVAAPFALSLLAACIGGSEGGDHGVIAGDLQLSLESGRVLKVMGNPVHLLRDTEELDSALARVCVQRDAEVERLRRQRDSLRTAAAGELDDSVAERLTTQMRDASTRALHARERILGGRALRTVETDTAAHFAFDSVQAGRYRLWSDAEAAGSRWTWLHRVKVVAGDSTLAPLNEGNADENPLRCRW